MLGSYIGDKVYVDLPTCTTPFCEAYGFQESTHELGNPLPYSIVPRMLGFGCVLKKMETKHRPNFTISSGHVVGIDFAGIQGPIL